MIVLNVEIVMKTLDNQKTVKIVHIVYKVKIVIIASGVKNVKIAKIVKAVVTQNNVTIVMV